MAVDTYESRQINKVETEDVNEDFFEFDVSASVLHAKPGRLYKIVAGGRTIKTAGAGDQADGIILHRDGYQHDGTTKRHLDLAYQNSDKNVRVARFCKNVGKVFRVFLANGGGCNFTTFYKSSGSGMVEAYVYGDAAVATDTLSNVNLKGDEYHGASGDDKIRKMVVARG